MLKIWLLLFVFFYIIATSLSLEIKDYFRWNWNYPLIISHLILAYYGIKWKLVFKQNIFYSLLGVLFILSIKCILYGTPQKAIIDEHLIWFFLQSFLGEMIFRGIFFANLIETEKKYINLSFPMFSLITSSIIFGFVQGFKINHDFNYIAFKEAFNISIYYSFIFISIKSYWASGSENFLKNCYSNFWN